MTQVKQVPPWQTGTHRYPDHVESGGSDGNEAAQRSAFEARAASILAMEDLNKALEEAGKLVSAQLEFRHEAAEIRAEVARRMYAAGGLSIDQVARKLGVSKARADRIIRRAARPPADES